MSSVGSPQSHTSNTKITLVILPTNKRTNLTLVGLTNTSKLEFDYLINLIYLTSVILYIILFFLTILCMLRFIILYLVDSKRYIIKTSLMEI